MVDRIATAVTEVWPARAVLGEGPVWDAVSGRVFWVDIKGRAVHAYRHVDGHRQSWQMPCRIGSLARPGAAWRRPDALTGDVFLCCGDKGLAWLALDGDTVALEAIVHPEAHLPHNRFNDGKLGPDGRYWAGSMDDREVDASGSLYAFAAGEAPRRLDQDYKVTNGPAFGPDGKVVYHTDSARQTIYRFNLQDDGSLADRRVLRQFGDGEGYPDGMTTDAEGKLWVAMWDGWRIQRLDHDGRLDGHVAMPVARCTSCVFIDARTLYVTSASIGVEGQPGAGSLFRVTLD